MTPGIGLRNYAIVTAAYWAFTLTDGALRLLVLLHFHELGYTPVQLAFLPPLRVLRHRHQPGRRMAGCAHGPLEDSLRGAEELVKIALERVAAGNNRAAPMDQSGRRIVPSGVGAVQQIGVPQNVAVGPRRPRCQLRLNAGGSWGEPAPDECAFIPPMDHATVREQIS